MSAEARSEAHSLRAAVVIGVLFTAFGMLWSLVLLPALQPRPPYHYWAVPGDVWHVMLAAHYVAWGTLPLIYEAGVGVQRGGIISAQTIQYQSGPLLPMLLSPLALLGDHLGLGESWPLWNPRPSMWLIYGPYGMLLSSIPFLYAVRSFAASATGAVRRRSLLQLQLAATVLILLPTVIYFGHFDDVLALTFVILCARDLSKEKWMRAAVMLGIAVGFKQWSWLALPLLMAVTPKEHRLRSLLPSVVAPAAFFALALAADWQAAHRALLEAITYPRYGHAALWVPASARTYLAGPTRAGTLIVAILIAVKMRGRIAPGDLSAALGLTFLSRLAFEPVVYTYYAIPGIAMLLLFEQIERGRPWRTFALGVVTVLLFQVQVRARVWWWLALAIVIGALSWPSVRRIFGAPSVGGMSIAARDDEHAVAEPLA